MGTRTSSVDFHSARLRNSGQVNVASELLLADAHAVGVAHCSDLLPARYCRSPHPDDQQIPT